MPSISTEIAKADVRLIKYGHTAFGAACATCKAKTIWVVTNSVLGGFECMCKLCGQHRPFSRQLVLDLVDGLGTSEDSAEKKVAYTGQKVLFHCDDCGPEMLGVLKTPRGIACNRCGRGYDASATGVEYGIKAYKEKMAHLDRLAAEKEAAEESPKKMVYPTNPNRPGLGQKFLYQCPRMSCNGR